jgi:hypothetical protein
MCQHDIGDWGRLVYLCTTFAFAIFLHLAVQDTLFKGRVEKLLHPLDMHSFLVPPSWSNLVDRKLLCVIHKTLCDLKKQYYP